MRAYVKLTQAGLKAFARDRSGLFWSVFFPIFFIVIFGTVFGGIGEDRTPRFPVGLVLGKPSANSAWITDVFREIPVLDVTVAELEEQRRKLAAGQIRAVVVFPPDYVERLRDPAPPEVTILHDPTRGEMGQAVVKIVREVLREIRLGKPRDGAGPGDGIREEAVMPQSLSGRNSRMIDFILPGILGMTIMQLGLFTAIPLITMREKGILKRLRATPVTRSAIVGSQVTQRLFIAMLQTGLIVGIGTAFYRVQVAGNWAALFGLVILGVLTFISLGAVLSAVAQTQESGVSVVQLVNFPMMFLSGVFFPPELIPSGIRIITNALPLTYLADALRHVILGSPSVFGIPTDLGVMALWLIGGLIVASRTFRWES